MNMQLTAEHIFIAGKPVDFRKGINSLCALVVETFSQPPQAGIFIFYNRQKNKIKILGWHRNGFVLVNKVLDRGKFQMSLTPESTALEMNSQQLSWLLAGLDWRLMSSHNELSFDDYF